MDPAKPGLEEITVDPQRIRKLAESILGQH
jgi:hypothetical protein